MATDGTKKKWTPARWLLVCSLGLNLMVAGLVGGALITGGPDKHDAHNRSGKKLRDAGNIPYVMALTREQRGQLIEDLGGRQNAFHENREKLRARFEETLTIIRTEPFDAKAMAALLAEQGRTLFERQKLGEVLVIDMLTKMSPEERATYAERLDKSLSRGPRKAP